MTDDKPRTQFPVQTSRLRDSVDGDARIIVARDSADAVRAVNGAIATADDLSRRSNPDATPAPRATDMIAVYDIDSRAFHSILLYRLDLRPRRAATVRKVVVFSDPPLRPRSDGETPTRHPGYYRYRADLQPGIRDPHDGTLAKDGSRWATSIMGGTVSARLTFVPSGEPWVYCASHYGSDSELRRLRSEFDTKYGYSVATRILDPNTFAAWLGLPSHDKSG